MKEYFYVWCILFCPMVSGQNLVKNPGFEEYYHLPDLIYEFGERYVDSAFICKHWYRVKGTTPDYMHVNAKYIKYGIPYNGLGYYPALADSAYLGFCILNLQGVTEPVAGEFTAPLEEGKKYEIGFFYCFANGASYFYSDKIEAFISADNWIAKIRTPWPGYEAIKKDVAANVIFETPIVNDGQWHKMTGHYQAKGGEKYISFGVFIKVKNLTKLSMCILAITLHGNKINTS